MNTVDTIAAIATGTGGAIAIIRISGEHALSAGNTVWRGRKTLSKTTARQMLYGLTGDPGEPALAVFMPNPHSYTGEDVVEIHCHGGPVAARRILEAVLCLPEVRAAEPGEFTMRAFVNGKLDLAQAEAVGDLIQSASESSFNLAVRQLSGDLSKYVNKWREILLQLASDCESRLDFPDEELAWDPVEVLVTQVAEIQGDIDHLLRSGHAGSLLRDGVRLVLAGRPNAGKSSLLNALLGIDRAIVSAIPGTTRDTLEERAVLRRIPVHITDTAGLREASDEIEALGVERAKAALSTAEVVFWVLDSASENIDAEIADLLAHTQDQNNVVAVWNKQDIASSEDLPEIPGVINVKISAKTGEGMEDLLNAFEKCVWQDTPVQEPEVAVNARHTALLNQVNLALSPVVTELLAQRWELAAAGLRRALSEAGKIVGETADADLLDEIFSRFCIGK